MPTYVYETLPTQDGAPPLRFQLRQGINDAPLVQHPENGEPVRRVISGGLGFLVGGTLGATDATASPSATGAGGNRSGGNCRFTCDCGF